MTKLVVIKSIEVSIIKQKKTAKFRRYNSKVEVKKHTPSFFFAMQLVPHALLIHMHPNTLHSSPSFKNN